MALRVGDEFIHRIHGRMRVIQTTFKGDKVTVYAQSVERDGNGRPAAGLTTTYDRAKSDGYEALPTRYDTLRSRYDVLGDEE